MNVEKDTVTCDKVTICLKSEKQKKLYIDEGTFNQEGLQKVSFEGSGTGHLRRWKGLFLLSVVSNSYQG